MAKKMKKIKKIKGKHSCPEMSGKQNLPKGYLEKNKGSGGGIMEDLLTMYNHGFKNREDYAGKWDRESLEKEVNDYLEFIAEHDIKPAKAGLRMWLGLSRGQYYEWEMEKSGSFKSDILGQVQGFMESQYISRGETHPTFNQFLLKSGYGYTETQTISVVGNDSENVKESIKKLGLDRE